MLESAGACLSAQAADEIEKVAHDSLELPGPTGESNRWTLYPRGNVLCLGPHAKSLRSQACQALALGNRVLAIGTDTTLLEPLRTDWPLEVITAIVEPDTLEGLSAINAIMLWLSGEALRPWRRALAQCDGPIIPLINEPGASQCLVIERHVCADTTASGGNTALLVQSA
jgi:RHH-type proline utilization regulon transcriptional repressor/proline dehydrogenase/delta 1-pyrroline-5-carboxylate dehydrogenase